MFMRSYPEEDNLAIFQITVMWSLTKLYITSNQWNQGIYKCIQVMEGVKLGWFEFQGAGVREQKGVSGLDWWLFMQLSAVSTEQTA